MPSIAQKRLATAVASSLLILGLGGCKSEQSTESLLQDAKQYETKGDRKAALIQLKNAVAQSPDNAEARMALGELQLEVADYASADKELRRARSLGVPAARVMAPLGKAMQALGKHQDVLKEIPPELAQGNAALLSLRGGSLLATGKAEEAQAAYRAAQAADPAAVAPRLGLASLALAQGDKIGALTLVDEAIAKAPNDASAHMFKGMIMRADGQDAAALDAFAQVLKLEPYHRSAYIERAYVQIKLAKFDEAQKEIDGAKKNAPGSLLVLYTQALLDSSRGKDAAAQENLLKVLRSAPDYMPAVLLAGKVDLALGSTQQAQQHLRKYLEANPENAYARKLLAQALIKGQRPAEANEVLAPALKSSPDDVQLLALAAESHIQAREFDKASAYLERATTLAPEAAVLRTSLGMARLGQGNVDKGVADLQNAVALDPASIEAATALARAQAGAKQYDKAAATLQKVAQHHPDNARVMTLQGEVQLASGDKAGARATFEKAAAADPALMPPVAHLARMDLADKQPEAAKKRFNAMLAKDPADFQALTALAEIAVAQNQREEATRLLEKAHNGHPDALPPALLLGRHYLGNKQPEKTIALARKLQVANPTDASLIDLLGQAQLAAKDGAGALESYSKLAGLQPTSAMAQLRLAAAHGLLKNQSAVLDDLKRAVSLDPDLLPARQALAQYYVQQGKVDDALNVARSMQQRDATRAAGLLLEGDIYATGKQPALAAAPYQKALALTKAPDMAVRLAYIYHQTGKTAELNALVSNWQKTNPTEVTVPAFVSEKYLERKDYKSAIAILEKTSAAAPNNPALLNNLAWAYHQVKDPRALATSERAVGLAGSHPAILDTAGWIMVERGDTARGLELLKKASAAAPNSQDIRYHLAAALAKSGDKTAARTELNKVIKDGEKGSKYSADAIALLQTL